MGMVTFLSSPVLGTFWSKKARKKYVQKGGAFPQYLSVWLLILHEVQQCTRNFSTNLTSIHKCLEKILVSRQSESKKISTKEKIQFGAKKVYFLSIRGCWSNWWKQFRVHCATPCKIMATGYKNCGNESKIHLTHKIRRFTPIFLAPGFLTKKHVNLINILDTPRQIFCARSNVQLMI